MTFRGTAAFSEPETQAVRAFCLEHDFKLALNYHTFGNYLIYPFIDGSGISQPELLFKNMGKVLNFENNFALGTDLQTVGYSVNGDSDNWMYGENGEKTGYLLIPLKWVPGFGRHLWILIISTNHACG